MANNKSAEKRIRQNEKRRLKNSREKSSLRTAFKKVAKSIADSSDSQEITDNFREFSKRIDTAAGRNVIHKRTAARRKSRLARKINAAVFKNNTVSDNSGA